MIFLETPRLLLRRFCENDFDSYWAFAADAEDSYMMGRPDCTSREDALANFNWLKDREPWAYALVLKETGELVGDLTITCVPKEIAALPAVAGRVGRTLSFCLARPYRRQGLMEEAVRAVIAHLFECRDINYINCGHFDFNEPSRRFQEKLGFARLDDFDLPIDGKTYHCIENIRWRDYFIKTPRLTLRRFRESDFADYCAYAMDKELNRMVGLDDIPNEEAARRSFEKLLRRPRPYALEHEGRVVGELLVEGLPPGVRDLKVLENKRGYALSFSLHRDFRRLGLMEEAVRGVICQLFSGEKLDFVNCGYFDFNLPSRRFQEKLGFKPLATHMYHRGGQRIRVVDNIIWQEDWKEETQ